MELVIYRKLCSYLFNTLNENKLKKQSYEALDAMIAVSTCKLHKVLGVQSTTSSISIWKILEFGLKKI
jgi:hypothetical protein